MIYKYVYVPTPLILDKSSGYTKYHTMYKREKYWKHAANIFIKIKP